MKQKVLASHEVDAAGNPTGGVTSGTGIAINWQNGPLGRGSERSDPNGAFVEGVLAAALDRLQFYQKANGGKFACKANACAITHIEEAMHWLEARTADREERAVEGTHAV